VRPGDEIELKVTPDRYATVRYAGASGDFNPIHIDEEFAARAHTEAFGGAGGPASLRSLSVQFRGMGVMEQEITVRATVEEVGPEVVTVRSEATQGGKRIVRNGRAEIRRPRVR